jgi:hypothetical protein
MRNFDKIRKEEGRMKMFGFGLVGMAIGVIGYVIAPDARCQDRAVGEFQTGLGSLLNSKKLYDEGCRRIANSRIYGVREATA